MVLIWSIATVFVGFTSSVYVILICRLVLGITEGIYWPQQSRFASDWFSDKERTQANSIIQYYGQFPALGTGFMILSPLDAAFGWRNVFIITGMIGIVVVVPLYITMLKNRKKRLIIVRRRQQRKLNLLWNRWAEPLPTPYFYLHHSRDVVLGITLWIPMVVNSLGYTGFSKALVSSLPYLTAVILAIPISWISDKTQKRVLIASLGLLIPGVMLFLLPFVDAPGFKITLITPAMGYYAASFTPNIWSIIQSNVKPHAIGPASGIINGIGAGGGGTLAGLMVGYFYRTTGSYMQGFMVLGCIVIWAARHY